MATVTKTDPEALARLIDEQRRRADGQLHAAHEEAEKARVEQVDARLERLAEFVAASKLPPRQRDDIKREAVAIQRTAYCLRCDMLLDQAMECARSGDKSGRASALATARDMLKIALSIGVAPDFRDSFSKKVEVLMLTEPKGTSAKAHVDRDKGWERRSKASDLVGAKARRRHLRYKDPPLVVTIGSVAYTTINWSLGGMRLRCEAPGFTVGETMTIAFHPEPLPGLTHIGRVQVAWTDADAGSVALAFATLDTAVIEMIRQLRKAGFDPVG